VFKTKHYLSISIRIHSTHEILHQLRGYLQVETFNRKLKLARINTAIAITVEIFEAIRNRRPESYQIMKNNPRLNTEATAEVTSVAPTSLFAEI
jgi:hypothetical protein